MKKLSIVILTLMSVSSAYARADVSLRNGNFFVSFRDISYPGGIEPKVERVYNSKSDFNGIFGNGWGTQYETHLNIDPDGSIIVTEYGGGANNRFLPKDYSAKGLNEAVNSVFEAAKKSGVVTSASEADRYKKRLTNDFDFRSKQYSIFVNKGTLQRKQVLEGTQYTTTEYQYQYITKVKGGYVRVMEAGDIQKFNEAGKMVQLMDRNKNFVNFTYDRNNHLIQLADNQNRKMNFTYNPQNLVDKITGESGKYAQYRYNREGFMVGSRDDNGVENTFGYTKDQFLNLNEIGYPNDKGPDGKPKKMTIQYFGPDKKSNVRAVTNPDGTTSEYEYLSDLKSPNYYAVHVLLKDAKGARISDSKYEYFYKTKLGGQDFTEKMISTIDGDKTETVYDQKLGYPVKIVNNGRTTTMEYDPKGRMIKKTTPIETTELSYDAKVGKVAKVSKKLKSGTVLWSEFQYDQASGNLLFARNNDKKTVKLVYDPEGRIRALVDQTGRQLTFRYNDLSKPIEISDPKLGTVKFSYKNSGEVDKIDSNGGANVATEVMRALQGLIDITAPAGVTMSI